MLLLIRMMLPRRERLVREGSAFRVWGLFDFNQLAYSLKGTKVLLTRLWFPHAPPLKLRMLLRRELLVQEGSAL